MGLRKGLHITCTDFSEPIEDHHEDNVEDHDAYETHSHHTIKMQGCQSNSQDAQASIANKNNKKQNSTTKSNAYEKDRELRVQENQKRLRDMGIKNIVNSMTSLAESQKMKKKTVKRNTHAGGVDYIPPMSMNRVVNLSKLRRVIASNVSQKVPSTSNATKSNTQRPMVTVTDIIKGNKGGAKRKLVLVDEDDETFQDDKSEDMGDTIHTNNQYELEIVDHDDPENEDNVQEQLQCREKEKTTGFDSKGNSTGRHKRLHITSTVSNDRMEDHVDDDHVEDNAEDHQVFETRGHQTSEIQGALKKVRGYTQKAETWKMDSTQRIVVTFNKFGMPVGEEGNELVQFLGTLVRMADHVSIEYSDWRKVPIRNKEDMYSLVKSKFVIHPNETNVIKKWIFHSMGRKWRAWKGSLKARVYDPSLTVDEIVAQQVNNDNRVNPTQFKELVSRWFTPEFQRTCDVKRSSRSKMKEPHVSGTKSFARLSHEMAVKNNGVYPTRGEMYVTTRTRKDGSIVDDKAAHVVASLKDIANDSTITPGDPADFTNDDYSKVKGPEKRGYVRLVGRMPAAKTNGASSTDSQTIDKLTSVVSAMAIIIQEHIPNANLSSVLTNMNIQVPGIGSLVHNNSLSVNESSSSKSHNDNGQERRLDN